MIPDDRLEFYLKGGDSMKEQDEKVYDELRKTI